MLEFVNLVLPAGVGIYADGLFMRGEPVLKLSPRLSRGPRPEKIPTSSASCVRDVLAVSYLVSSSPPRRTVVAAALVLLIAISLPRYVDRLSGGDYARTAQMVALVWLGFFASARYWVRGDARFSRSLVGAAAAICIPPLLYHLYRAYNDSVRLGNLVLLAGIATYSYGVLARGERIKREPLSKRR